MNQTKIDTLFKAQTCKMTSYARGEQKMLQAMKSEHIRIARLRKLPKTTPDYYMCSDFMACSIFSIYETNPQAKRKSFNCHSNFLN